MRAKIPKSQMQRHPEIIHTPPPKAKFSSGILLYPLAPSGASPGGREQQVVSSHSLYGFDETTSQPVHHIQR